MKKTVLALAILAAALAPQLKAFTISLNNCAQYLDNLDNVALRLPSRQYIYDLSDIIAGPAHVRIKANLTATAPVEVAVTTSDGEPIYRTLPASSISGEYNVTIKDAGMYYTAIYNPSNSTASVHGWLEIEVCGPYAPEVWLNSFRIFEDIELSFRMAPMSIAIYGVINASGTYYTYTLKTDAVMGKAYIPSNVLASTYSQSRSYYSNVLIHLIARVAVELANGQTQYYWLQNTAYLEDGVWWGWNLLSNDTTRRSHLSPSAIRGNGDIWNDMYSASEKILTAGMSRPPFSSVPFGWVTLGISAGVAGGSVVVRFYANGRNYDTVTITPSAPATSAYIIVAPKVTPSGIPLNLELIFAGINSSEPYAMLKNGSLQLQLYVDVNGTWVPPPSAWIVRSSTVKPGVLSPGSLNITQLWSITVVVGPTGAVATTDTNLTRYFPPVVHFGNGTRLLLAGAYINGQLGPTSALSHVPVGSLVVGNYVKQYYVVINAPGNRTAGWYNAGSTLAIQPAIYFGNRTRLANPSPALVEVSRPLNITVSYAKQYYVVINAPGNVTAGWYNAGSILYVQPVVDFGNGTRLVSPSPSQVAVAKPLNVTVKYVKQYRVVINAPGNATRGWFDAGATLYIQPAIYLGNGTRLVRPTPPEVHVTKPLNVTVTYARQYLVSVSSIFGSSSTWADAGSLVSVNASARSVGSAYFKPSYLLVNGRAERLGPVEATRPLDVRVVYSAEANASVAWLGLPAFYAQGQLVCGNKSAFTPAFFAYTLRLAMEDPPTYDCKINTAAVPLAPVIAVAAIAVAVAAWRRRR